MATKKASKKKAPAKRRSPSRSAKVGGKVTKSTITFRLTPDEIRRAQECLARSGTITYTFKDVRVTKLPHILDDGKLID